MRDKPDAKVQGYIDARYKQGEVCRVELTVEHFVDDWFETDFVFRVSDGVATLHGIENCGDSYWVRQNKPAREKAYLEVEQLPCVDEVVRIND